MKTGKHVALERWYGYWKATNRVLKQAALTIWLAIAILWGFILATLGVAAVTGSLYAIKDFMGL